MNRTQLAARCSAAATVATLIAGLAVAPAVARPDSGGQFALRWSSYENCPLNRIDSQLVRCDQLTGAGVDAPLFVPEY
jgi:hypothetical protein